MSIISERYTKLSTEDQLATVLAMVEQIGVLELRIRQLELAIGAVTHTAPGKVAVPTLRIADGVHWNPGGGTGIYLSMDNGASWWKL
jgi:hypothetical protein